MKSLLSKTIIVFSSMFTNVVLCVLLLAGSSQFDSGFGGYTSLAKTLAYIYIFALGINVIATLLLHLNRSEDRVSKWWFTSSLLSFLIVSFIPTLFELNISHNLFTLAWEIVFYKSEPMIIYP